MWKDFFYYSKSERRVIILLLFLAAALFAINIFFNFWEKENTVQKVQDRHTAQIDSFLTHLKTIKKNRFPYNTFHQKDGKKPSKSFIKKQSLFTFDPNTADSVQLSELGLSSFSVNNIIKYRRKGGVFHTAQSLKKIYGIDYETYTMLQPYITIGKEFITEKRDTVHYKKTEKYAPGTVVCINSADTLTLRKIPGIGKVLSERIISYRDRLGGFSSLTQLQEINGIDTVVNKWFSINPSLIKKISVNTCRMEELTRHPYIRYDKAKEIMKYRKRYGKIKSFGELSMLSGFTEKEVDKLKVYLSF